MAIVTGDRYLESLVKFVENQAGPLIEGTLILKLNPAGIHYVQSRLEDLAELESLLTGAPVDYLRAYISDLGDHRALEQLRRILRLLTSLKVVSVLPLPARDPTPLSLMPFGRLKVLELRGCDLSTSAPRGLLELRHTLEKIICHNSTDAIRHVFASRIVEIKDSSPQWNRLSFVSCACNGLLLMDESLQLLPVVETLDLSRNKFAKVDNLRKCTKLKHLDLGFNHLRTIASFREVSSQIVKLVLRNNALTTLRGIEKLKSLEGLDLSYNIISNFFELDILADLPSLESLWLEGNPLCSARWYRAQVFSFFPHPDKLKLDEKKICTKEFWKRQIIIASRQKRPASFGFYSPAKDNAELEGSINSKRKKLSRLACIEGDEKGTFVSSDQESVSCDNEVRSKEENAISDEEGEIIDLMSRIEFMKKERSLLWLLEFKEWMNQASEKIVDGSKYDGSALNHDKGNYLKNKTRHKHFGEPSRYVSDSVQASGDESSTNFLESDNSFADISTGFSAHQYFDRIGEAASKFFMGHAGEDSVPVGRIEAKQEHLKSYHNKGAESVNARNSHLDSFAALEGDRMSAKNSFTSLGAIDDVMESHSSSACPGSPPHYQEDILHRRHNLEEEFLQLSAESYSMASSDSNTSHSEDDSAESVVPQFDISPIDELSERSVDGHSSVLSSVDSYYAKRHTVSQLTQNGKFSTDSGPERTSGTMELRDADLSLQLCSDGFPSSGEDGEIVRLVKQEANWLEKKKCKRKPIKRVISLSEEHNMDGETESSHKLNGSLGVCKSDVKDELGKKVSRGSDFQKNAITTSPTNDSGKVLSGTKSSSLGADDLIVNYFRSNIADFGLQETCRLYTSCNCLLEKNEGKESEVAVILSSEHKLFTLLTDGRYDGPGTGLRLIGCHRIEDVKEVLVGLALQVVRVCIERDATYLFITRSIEKSRQLLCILDFFSSRAIEDDFSLRSLEQVQVELFEREVCGASKINMFQYSIVLFWHSNLEEDIWLSRSLFVLGGYLLVCIEDLMQFGSLSEVASSSSYFLLDSYCSIVDVLEMVLETEESHCETLFLKCAMLEYCHYTADKVEDAAVTKEKPASGPLTWKLKWFSKESLFKFVALLKAVHAAATVSPVVVRYLS